MFVDEALALFAERFSAGKQFRPVRINSVHVDGDTGIVVWNSTGLANDGLTTTPTHG